MAKKPIIRVTFEVETDDANETLAGLEGFKEFLNLDYFECSLGEHVRTLNIEELPPAEAQLSSDDDEEED